MLLEINPVIALAIFVACCYLVLSLLANRKEG